MREPVPDSPRGALDLIRWLRKPAEGELSDDEVEAAADGADVFGISSLIDCIR